MTDSNRPWWWKRITADIFVGIVSGIITILIGQWISHSNSNNVVDPPSEPTVTATATITTTATATTTVTVTAPNPDSDGGSVPSTGQQFLVDQKSSNPKGSVKTNESPRIDGKMYPHSIRTYCVNRCVQYPSSIEYGIGSNYSTLTTTVGVDADNGDSKQIIKFNVWLIGVSGGEDKPAVTEVRKAGEKKEISVPLNGASRVRLETLYGGEDPKEAENMEIVAVWGTPILS